MSSTVAAAFPILNGLAIYFAGRCDRCHKLSERLTYYHEIRDENGVLSREFVCKPCQGSLRIIVRYYATPSFPSPWFKAVVK